LFIAHEKGRPVATRPANFVDSQAASLSSTSVRR
jgi:hypothetical protein